MLKSQCFTGENYVSKSEGFIWENYYMLKSECFTWENHSVGVSRFYMGES